MSVLEVTDVVKRYQNGTLANDGISLSLEQGEVYGLLGQPQPPCGGEDRTPGTRYHILPPCVSWFREKLNLSDILIVPTALRPNANSTRVADALITPFVEAGAIVTTFDLTTLPLFGTVDPQTSQEVLAYREAVSSADAVIWVVPTYHNDMPGSAKNALDHLDIMLMSGTTNAVVGVASGSSFPGAAAFSACVRFIGGRFPLRDVFVGDISNRWSADTEAPEELVDQMRTFAEQFTGAVDASTP